jgi:protein-disulfide isomerase
VPPDPSIERRARPSVLLLALLVTWAVACSAQEGPKGRSGFAENPIMTRGPADAPVSIVEFSDYQ